MISAGVEYDSYEWRHSDNCKNFTKKERDAPRDSQPLSTSWSISDHFQFL